MSRLRVRTISWTPRALDTALQGIAQIGRESGVRVVERS